MSLGSCTSLAWVSHTNLAEVSPTSRTWVSRTSRTWVSWHNNPMTTLGLDAGATHCKWSVLKAGVVLAQGTSSPITGHGFDVAGQQAVRQAILALAKKILPHSPQAIVAGVTGLSKNDDVAQFISACLAKQFELPEAQVQIINDMDLAYRAQFVPGEGLLLYAGTGAIAYHVAADDSVIRAGGHGYLIDDLGGGFWMGQALLRLATRDMDLNNHSPLLQQVFKDTQTHDWPSLRSHIYGGGRRNVALLAPTVGELAANGNAEAQNILVAASGHLVEITRRLQTRMGQEKLPIVFLGGAFQVSPILVNQFLKEFSNAKRGHENMAETAARMAEKLF